MWGTSQRPMAGNTLFHPVGLDAVIERWPDHDGLDLRPFLGGFSSKGLLLGKKWLRVLEYSCFQHVWFLCLAVPCGYSLGLKIATLVKEEILNKLISPWPSVLTCEMYI